MSNDSLVSVIMKVLEESAISQVKLGSESARIVLSEQIVEAVTEEIRAWFDDDDDEDDEEALPIEISSVQIDPDDYI